MMSYPELLKKVFAFYSEHFRKFFVLLIFTLAWNIFLSVTPINIADTVNFRFLIPFMIGSFLISSYTELLLVGGFSALHEGTEISLKPIFAQALRKLPLFLLLLVAWGFLVFIGMLFLIVPAIIFGTWFMFLACTVMIEHKRFNAFRRSKMLVSNNFFSLLLRVGCTIVLVVFIVQAASQGFATIAERISPASALPSMKIIGNIFSSILSTLFLPVITGTIVELYYEMKKVKGQPA